MAKFDRVYIEISNVCNLQCSFCPEVIRPKALMSPELFKKTIDEVAPLTEQVTFHLMGDPLLHPQFSDFVEYCQQKNLRIQLTTNATLLTNKKAEGLLHPAFRQVNFSLHSFFDNFPDRDPNLYLQKIFAFTEQALEKRPDLYINYRLWNLAEARGQLQANKAMLSAIGEKFLFQPPPEVDVRRKKSFLIQGRLYLHFDTEFTWPSLDLPIISEKGTCRGLSNHIGILADGTVVPCCLDKEAKAPLGSLQEKNLSEILAGTRSQNILQGFQKNELREDLCQRCQYATRFKQKTLKSLNQQKGASEDSILN